MRIAARALVGAVAMTTAASISAQEMIAAPAMPIDTMREALKRLSSDEFEGRAPGTTGEVKTLDFIVKHFEQAGLKPANKGGWFQDVPLVAITSQNHSGLKISGGKQPLNLTHGSDYVAVSYRVAPKSSVTNSDVVFVGYGINAPERGWNDYAGVDVRGKTVLVLINDPDWRTQSLEGVFDGRAMTYYGRWTYKLEEAARQGAAAAIIIHQDEPAGYGWGTVQVSWSGRTNIIDRSGDGDRPAVSGWLHQRAARTVLANAGEDFAALELAAGRKGFRAVSLNGLKASLSFDNVTEKHRSKNVVGILPGTSRAEEYILHTAHWDHLGRCAPAPDGDDICNGALDNASGTAGLIALAQAHGEARRTDRSLVFVAFTAEESYLLGSEFYAENPIFPLNKTVAGLNMDLIFPMPPARNAIMIGRGKSSLDTYLDAALSLQGRVNSPDPTPEKGFYYRSDHFSLARRGVPMLYLYNGDDLIEGGTEAGRKYAADYYANRYHSPKDEFDPKWRWDGVEADLRVYFDFARALAATDDWPNWVLGDEFRATRDKSRSEKRP